MTLHDIELLCAVGVGLIFYWGADMVADCIRLYRARKEAEKSDYTPTGVVDTFRATSAGLLTPEEGTAWLLFFSMRRQR